MTADRHEWWAVVRDALAGAAPELPVDAAAGAVVRALEDAGLPFPDRDRRPAPRTPEDHLWEAARLLEMSITADTGEPGGYHVWDDHCRAQVGAAEVHARIAHAWSALGLLAGRESVEVQAGPGLPALERLAHAMTALAETVDVRRSAIRTRST